MVNKIVTKKAASLTVIALLLVAMMLMLPVTTVLAAPLSEEIDNLDTEIRDKKEKTESVKEGLGELKSDLDSLIAEYQKAYAKLHDLDADIAEKQRELNSATEQQIFYQKILNRLSVFTYRDGDVYFFEVVLGTRSFKDLIVRFDYLVKLSQRQAEVLRASKRLRSVVKNNRDQLAAQKARQKELVADLHAKQDNINRLLASQQTALNALDSTISDLEKEKSAKEKAKKRQEALARARAVAEANKNVTVPADLEIAFPVPSPYAHSYINDWGFSRAGNPSGHQGTDIFAAKGTPLVAVADGVIDEQFGDSRIGGFRLHVIADNGVDYYYAHLNNDTPGTDDGQGGAATAYAPGIAPGVRVKKGQLVGYVGDSGDAEPTPPHLHFGISISGHWVPPFPYLTIADWR